MFDYEVAFISVRARIFQAVTRWDTEACRVRSTWVLQALESSYRILILC